MASNQPPSRNWFTNLLGHNAWQGISAIITLMFGLTTLYYAQQQTIWLYIILIPILIILTVIIFVSAQNKSIKAYTTTIIALIILSGGSGFAISLHTRINSNPPATIPETDPSKLIVKPEPCIYPEQIPSYKFTIGEIPDEARSAYENGRILAEKGQLTAAIESYTTSIETSRQYYLPYLYRGRAYIELFLKNNEEVRLQNSINDLIAGISLNKNNHYGYYNLTIAYHLMFLTYHSETPFLLDCAAAYGEHTIELDKDNYAAHKNLGQVYISQERTCEAINSLRKALELKSDYDAVYYYLGEAYHQLGDLKTAQYNYELLLNSKDPHIEVTNLKTKISSKLAEIKALLEKHQPMFTPCE